MPHDHNKENTPSSQFEEGSPDIDMNINRELAILKNALDEHAIMSVADVAGNIIEVNDKFCVISGYKREELLGQNHKIVKSDEHSDAFFVNMWKTISSGRTWHGDIKNTNKTGEDFWVATTIVPTLDDKGKPLQYVGIRTEITKRKQAELRERSRTHVLELITKGEPLPVILDAIVKVVEQDNPAMLCSVLLLDDTGKHLLSGTASSLPDFYNEAIHGVEIGEGVGSCGTAAFLNQRVIVDDIQTHAYWVSYKELAKEAGLGACWSEPIRSSKGKVLGTFAIYHRNINHPTEADIALIEQTANMASIAIEKKQAREKLIKSEELLRLSSELANVAAWEMDLVADSMTRSSNHDNLYGLTDVGQWHVNTFMDATHVDDREKCNLFINRSLAPGGPDQYKFDFRIHYPDQSIHWLNVIGVVIARDSEGVGIKLRGFITDITDRKEGELAVQRSQKLLTETEQIGKVGGWEFDIDSGKQTWTEEVYRIHELDHDSEPSVATGVNFYTAESRPTIEQAVQRIIEHGEPFDLLLEIITAKGNLRSVHTIGKADLENRRIYGFFQDVTDIQNISAERDLLSKASQATTSGIVITDKHKDVVWVNEAFTTITGYSLAEVKGFSLKTFLQGKKTSQTTALEINQTLEDGNEVDVEILNYRKGGQPYWNHLKISPVREHGEIKHFIEIQQDITEKKEQHETIVKMQRLEMMSQLSMGIAHDFNNILGIISGNQEIAKMVNTQPQLVPLLNAIEKATERASNLTTKLLKSSKHSHSQQKLDSIQVLIQDFKAMITESVPNNVSMRWQIDEAITQTVDILEFQDVLLNLVVNAKNAIHHHGSISLAVNKAKEFNAAGEYEVSKPLASSAYVVLSVEDTGEGIPNDKFDDIFLPFASHSSKEGTGLGLTMVLGFIGRHNYGLTLHSEPGVGTKFSIWIPESYPQITEKLNSHGAESGYLRAKNIVLIDDEIDLLNVTTSLLQLHDHKVTSFNNPEEAIAFIEDNKESIDLIITDEVMPGSIQGHNIVAMLKDFIPVILISGYTEPDNIKGLEHLLLAKPFGNNALHQKIAEVLNGVKMET
ncbi:PAS domain S-box protein [Paraglaciecola sp. 25GB23A]|uniref:PAS domain S-box protein n=1 Tax=Paraglaciecola sp. 25GB23A TaxID=3156068 RepID=UPI0032AF166F